MLEFNGHFSDWQTCNNYQTTHKQSKKEIDKLNIHSVFTIISNVITVFMIYSVISKTDHRLFLDNYSFFT